jgi:hypothetical protein
MIRHYAFPSVGSSRCPPPHMTADTISLMLYTDGVSDHPVLKDFSPKRLCWFLRDCRMDRRFLWPKASVHLVLKSLSWRVSVLIQTKHLIDRQCPQLDSRIIRCYCLLCFSSAIHPMHLEYGPPDHPMVSVDLRLLAVYQLHRRLHRWYCRFIRRCLFPSFSSHLQLAVAST